MESYSERSKKMKRDPLYWFMERFRTFSTEKKALRNVAERQRMCSVRPRTFVFVYEHFHKTVERIPQVKDKSPYFHEHFLLGRRTIHMSLLSESIKNVFFFSIYCLSII
jgi:hypothetical protein